MIDALTPETPVLLSRWDRSEYLANALALELAGIELVFLIQNPEHLTKNNIFAAQRLGKYFYSSASTSLW